MNKKATCWITIGCVLVCVLLFALYVRGCISTKYAEVASLIGCTVSVVAWGITLYQLSAIRKSAEVTQEATKNTQQTINHLFAISDISVAVGYAREVIGFMRNKRFEVAEFRMHDIKKVIWSMERIESKLRLNQGLSEIKTTVGILTGNLNNHTTNEIDIRKFNVEIEKIISFLLTVENTLKNIDND